MSEKKVVAFSLWGDKPMYLRGAISNLVMYQRMASDWTCRFYLSPELASSKLAIELVERGAEIKDANPLGDPLRVGLYWRLDALLDTSVDIAIFRDTDSRPSKREIQAVEAWVGSGLPLHAMRDHRAHTAPLMGGMWGCRPAKLKRVVKGLRTSLNLRMDHCLHAPLSSGKSKHGRYAFSDQDWLADVVWPKAKDKAIVHTGERAPSIAGGEVREFGIAAQSPQHFVGQAYTVQGVPKWPV